MVRAAELEFEKMEKKHRDVDAVLERKALAKSRHTEAAQSRADDLTKIEADRADAIATAAQQAAETLKVETRGRLAEYRSERDIEQEKIEKEHRGAAIRMARKAQEARLLHEKWDIEQETTAALTDQAESRMITTLMGKVQKEIQPTDEDLDAGDGRPIASRDDESVVQEAPIGLLQKVIGVFRRAA